MTMQLIVRDPFGDYAKGAVITDPDAIAAFADAGNCVPFDVPDAPAPAAPAIPATPAQE